MANKQTKNQPTTERGKLESYITQLEFILHPNLFEAFKRQLNACYEENKRDAYASAKISEQALWIEDEVLRIKKNPMGTDDPGIKRFLIKCFYKELLKKMEVHEAVADQPGPEDQPDTKYEQPYLH